MRKVLRMYTSETGFVNPKEIEKFFKLAEKYRNARDTVESGRLKEEANLLGNVLSAGENTSWKHELVFNQNGKFQYQVFIIYEKVYSSLLSGGQDDKPL